MAVLGLAGFSSGGVVTPSNLEYFLASNHRPKVSLYLESLSGRHPSDFWTDYRIAVPRVEDLFFDF